MYVKKAHLSTSILPASIVPKVAFLDILYTNLESKTIKYLKIYHPET